MYPASFDYTLAESAVHAVELLSRYGEGVKLLSGGQSLIPLLKLRLVRPKHLVDIGRVTDLAYVRSEDAFLSIGALATHAQVGASALVAETIPLMAEAASSIGDPQVRGWGTVGGALAEADPAGDWGPALLALRGEVECVSTRGKRSIQSDVFFVDAYTTGLADDEMITGIRVPVPGEGTTGVYLKLERRAGDFAVASVALQLDLDEEHNCRSASIALGAAGLKPVRAVAAEASLTGQTLSDATIKAARREIVAAVEPLGDVRGSEAYKRAVCGALFEQALDAAVRQHRGEKARGGHVR
jgi:carbon-monoxide dehydrogenase medium subunit